MITPNSSATPVSTTPDDKAIAVGSVWDPTIFLIVFLVPLVPIAEPLIAYMWMRREKIVRFIPHPHVRMPYSARMRRMGRRRYGSADSDFDTDADLEDGYTPRPERWSRGKSTYYPSYGSTPDTLSGGLVTEAGYSTGAYGYASGARARKYGQTSSMGSTSTTSHYVTPSALHHSSQPHSQPSSSTPTPPIHAQKRDSALRHMQSTPTTSDSSRATSPTSPVSPSTSNGKQKMVIPIISVSYHDDDEDTITNSAPIPDFVHDHDSDEFEVEDPGDYEEDYLEEDISPYEHGFRGVDVLSDIYEEEEGSLPSSSVTTTSSFVRAHLNGLPPPQALHYRVQRVEPSTP